ncbi:TPA: hypothetical protein NJ211_004649, partial [Vibrio parahaemolyticus]|nr:hypothetical protein [Vibrio parahaemolyticus]HCG6702050.1 hypothetical protein [Vibrio parahaemolyticus]HCG6712564.1 hypothetical protein [Vibrio parahaemolyticus]
ASEMLNQMNGRSSGVFDWWKLLQSILDKEGVTELQEIADDVFAMSFKKIERVIEEAGKG